MEWSKLWENLPVACFMALIFIDIVVFSIMACVITCDIIVKEFQKLREAIKRKGQNK